MIVKLETVTKSVIPLIISSSEHMTGIPDISVIPVISESRKSNPIITKRRQSVAYEI